MRVNRPAREAMVLLGACLGAGFLVTTCGGNAGDGLTTGGTGGTGGVNDPPPPPTACPVIPALRLTNGPGVSLQPAIVWTGSGYFVAWGDARNGGMDIYGVMLGPDGSRSGDMQDALLANTAGLAQSPEIALLPDGGFLVVFEECDGSAATANCAVYSVKAGADGRPAGEPMVVSPPVPVQRRPYLAPGHGQIYVTFRDLADVGGTQKTLARLTTLTADGAAAGPGVMVKMEANGQYPHVAVGPNQVALVYKRDNPTAEIALALFDPALTFQEEIVVRAGMSSDATNPVVQWNTTRWVVAWEDQRTGEAAIFATVVDQQGNAMPAQQAYDENGNWPTIASGGLMTSLIGFYGYPGERVFLARLEADGRLKPGQVVLDRGKFPAVAYNSAGGVRKMGEYAVVYENVGLGEIMFARFECQD